jgi:hypothetical protein
MNIKSRHSVFFPYYTRPVFTPAQKKLSDVLQVADVASAIDFFPFL